MSKLQLSMCTGRYDRLHALFDGTVEPEGIDLYANTYKNVDDLFRQTLTDMQYDISELSMSNYLYAHALKLPIIAIPVFPSRKFRHYNMYANKNSVKRPKDLKGKKVGSTAYYVSAAIWQRGILEHEYGVKPSEITWYTEKPERLKFKVPKNVSIEIVKGGYGALNKMLERGEIDAMIGPTAFPSGSKNIVSLFEDPIKAEMDYFKRTGIFPIMHTIVIKERVLKEHPWVATSMFDAFEKAKSLWTNYSGSDMGGMAWKAAMMDEEKAVLGSDPYPYGIEKNRKVLKTMIQYCREQGVIQKDVKIEQLFAKNTVKS